MWYTWDDVPGSSDGKDDEGHIYTMEYYSAITKWNLAICSNMNGPRKHNTKWVRERQIWYHLYVELKNNTNESIYKTETDSQT